MEAKVLNLVKTVGSIHYLDDDPSDSLGNNKDILNTESFAVMVLNVIVDGS